MPKLLKKIYLLEVKFRNGWGIWNVDYFSFDIFMTMTEARKAQKTFSSPPYSRETRIVEFLRKEG